ncbi:MAG: PTS sugar transporter subunit IIA [Chitinispirillia bacterium]|nr:PTS sugar transporter subunit IIA [Chitinispirillia bacterium]MCL2267761.1 PTS sugar transporter subunit IIA [Chitinispirillia bacterium]
MTGFENYLITPNVIDIVSDDKTGSFKELATALCKSADVGRQKLIVEEILKREESASTFIGNGVALPHARGCAIKNEFAIVVGRSINGINYDAARNAAVNIVILLVSREDADIARQLEILSELASFFKSGEVREKILTPGASVDLRALSAAFKKGTTEKKLRKNPTAKNGSSPVLNAAVNMARELKARAIIVFADVVKDNDFLDQLGERHKLIIVTNNKTRFDLAKDKRVLGLVQAPPIPVSRTGQLKIGILLAMSRGFLTKEDKVVCVSGLGGTNSGSMFDTVVSVDIAREYDFFFLTSKSLLPPDIKPEVFERVMGLAGEIAVEGREGKAVGTIFVLGDTNSVNANVRQLIINPFRGYSESERNILDPGLVETIKEFAAIDGAFIVTGDGVILSAGSYLRPQQTEEQDTLLPGGLGARHAAAAGISACTQALAITISESTGTVNVFKNGTIMLSLSRPVVRERDTVNLG